MLETTTALRVWRRSFPFHARSRLANYRLVATDTDWHRGDGLTVAAPVASLLLLLTGRTPPGR